MQLNAKTLHEFSAAIEELVGFYQMRDKSVVCYYDITVSECHALAAIDRQGPLPVMAVSGALRLDKSTTSRILSSLRRKGYVRRDVDATDGRQTLISLTPAGSRLHRKIRMNLMDEYALLLSKETSSFARRVPAFLREVTSAARTRHNRGLK